MDSVPANVDDNQHIVLADSDLSTINSDTNIASNPSASMCHKTSDDNINSTPPINETVSDTSKTNTDNPPQQAFYADAQSYWDHVEPTIDGMLGGFAPINHIDIRGSLAYLQSMYRLKPPPGRLRALDCGAGIGRVTRFLLLPQFECVDAVEQCAKFAQEMRTYVVSPKLGRIYNQGLQEFTPEDGCYDLIWSQWVLGHLPDVDLISFFQRCVRGLSKNGILIIKENVTSSTEQVIVDEVDSSLTRPLEQLKRLLVLGGWRIVRCTQQHNFPAGIYPVYMITARPQ